MTSVEGSKAMIPITHLLMRRVVLIILAGSIILLVACDAGTDSRADLAIIESVDIVETGQPSEFYAVVDGFYPDNCSTTGDIVQRTQGRTIRVTVYTSSSGDASCEPVLTPFTERIRLDVDDLSPGQYTVDVNGSVSTMTII